MARLIGPDESSRLAYGQSADGRLTSAAGLTAVVYADAGGTTLADVLTYPGGAAIAGSAVTVASTSLLPLIQYPDGVDTVYVSVNGGPVHPVYARTDDRLDTLTTGLAAEVAAGAAHTADTTTVHGIADTAVLETQTGAQDRVDALETALTAVYLALTGGTLTGDLEIQGVGKGYRLRRGGSALDLEATGTDLLLSVWSGTAYDGIQRSYARLSADATNVQWAGRQEYVTALYGGAVHALDPITGVAELGGRNGLTVIRLCGYQATAGAPSSGTWSAGDVVLDSVGSWHLCTVGGTPGTWVEHSAVHDVAQADTDSLNRAAAGAEGSDVWQIQYAGARGLYANGYGCGRARVPAHADAAEQVAWRSACHSSKDGTAQVISASALSDNTHISETRANGEFRINAPRWLDATLGASMSAGTAVAPGTSREGARCYLRGTLAWTAATIAGGSTLLTVNSEHRPTSEKTFSVRTSPSSNVATQLHLNPDGTLTNETSFGAGTTADVGVDGLNWDLS